MNYTQTRFLVVDDFEPMRKVTAGQLRAMGAKKIVMAKNGAEALHIIQHQQVDIVLADWNMPVMTGLDLLKAVRSSEKMAHLPFIMITAEGERHRIEEAIACGVTDLLVKPYTADSLAKRVEKALTSQPRSIPRLSVDRDVVPDALNNVSIAAGSEETTEPVRPTILVVDDTPDNILILRQLFKDEYRVRIAKSGNAALDICQSYNPPDMVLLDIMMPGMDGFEVARRMREHPTSETIPVIFITAMTGEEARHIGLELGAVDFISKPIDPYILKTRVLNFMRYVELHRQLQASYDNMLDLSRLQSDVEHTMRHDMKGALAGVIGLVQALGINDSMNKPQVGQLRMIEETALQVLDMINLSSELFKIETGRFNLDAKPVMIDYILQRIIEILDTSFSEKELIIRVEINVPIGEDKPMVFGDAMFCYSIFQNLIKNACEAAPEKSLVLVTLINEAPLRIVIQNRGAVPMGIRRQFFSKYVTQGKQEGNGLGTYSAKMLVEAQNGTISLEVSDKQDQTTVAVTLPRYSKLAR